MGKIVISENVSLDGVIQDPAGDEGFTRGGWVGRIATLPEVAKVTLDEALGTEALLLGRRSYKWFAARWPSRSGELADRLNSLPKYVVSSTLEDPDWNNSTVLKGDVVNEVSKLKQELNGEIHVPASFQLARTLIEHDLVDELRLKIFQSCSGPASASSARPATRSRCGSSTRGRSETASSSSPMSWSETPVMANGMSRRRSERRPSSYPHHRYAGATTPGKPARTAAATASGLSSGCGRAVPHRQHRGIHHPTKGLPSATMRCAGSESLRIPPQGALSARAAKSARFALKRSR
jgi:dihydrofolate reductase